MDPWGCEVESAVAVSKFEDDFAPPQEPEKLADSEEYLAILGTYICFVSNSCTTFFIPFRFAGLNGCQKGKGLSRFFCTWYD